MKGLLHVASEYYEAPCDERDDLIALYTADAQDALWNDSSTFLHK